MPFAPSSSIQACLRGGIRKYYAGRARDKRPRKETEYFAGIVESLRAQARKSLAELWRGEKIPKNNEHKPLLQIDINGRLEFGLYDLPCEGFRQ